MNVVRPKILLSCALVLLMAASFHGQSPSQGSDTLPTFHSKVRLVLVDVVVATSKGEPVGGLQKEDFQVSENGKSQKVVFFEEHKGTARVRTELPSMPADVFTNYPNIKPADSVNVLLLDWLNTQPQDQAFVRAQVLKYLKQVPPGTRIAVFALGTRLQMVQGFTTDLSLLSSVLQNSKSVKTRFSPLLPTAVGEAADQELIALMEMNQTAPAAVEAARQEMSVTSASDTGLRMAITLEAFQELERYLSPIPGRKNIIWLADSFPITVFPKRGHAPQL